MLTVREYREKHAKDLQKKLNYSSYKIIKKAWDVILDNSETDRYPLMFPEVDNKYKLL